MNTTNYVHLQSNIDRLVNKYGLEKSNQIIATLINPVSSFSKQAYSHQLVDYIKRIIVDYFQLEADLLITTRNKKYRNARTLLFSFIKEYTDFSLKTISQLFQVNKHQVFYATNRVKECLEVPEYHVQFMVKYQAIEKQIIHYISHHPPC